MIMSRGLVISLGVSVLSCTLLFLYFRNKFTNIEGKVDVMFDLIQNHEQQESPIKHINEDNGTNQENWTNTADDNTADDNTTAYNTTDYNQKDKIMISEDDDDSEEISDSDDEESDTEEEVPKLSLANTENITLSVADVKKVTIQEIGNNNNRLNEVNDFDDVDSLDEIDIEEDDDGDKDDVSKIVLKKIHQEDKLIDNIPGNSGNDDTENSVDNEDGEVDYNKLKVSELKSIAENMGLTNYKSLKKAPLVDLIKSQE